MADLYSSGGRKCCILLLLFAFITSISAFAVPSPERMFDYNQKAPTFNKQTSLWEPSPKTEDPPYGPWGSLLRGGPSPFLVRILQPNEYDQAVFKYSKSLIVLLVLSLRSNTHNTLRSSGTDEMFPCRSSGEHGCVFLKCC